MTVKELIETLQSLPVEYADAEISVAVGTEEAGATTVGTGQDETGKFVVISDDEAD